MENAINVSLLSVFLQKLKSSFLRWPSCYAQWEVHSENLSLVYSVTKNQVGNEAMCKDVSCFTYNDQTNCYAVVLVVVLAFYFHSNA